MADEQRQDQSGTDERPENREYDEFTRAAGNREDVPQEEAENTPPGGDVRTAYSNDRAPGEAEPNQKKP